MTGANLARHWKKVKQRVMSGDRSSLPIARVAGGSRLCIVHDIGRDTSGIEEGAKGDER